MTLKPDDEAKDGGRVHGGSVAVGIVLDRRRRVDRRISVENVAVDDVVAFF